MAAPAAEAPPEANAAAPGGGATQGQAAQIVQQIEQLLTMLQQEEPDPDVQRLVKQAQPIISQLQEVAGKDDTEDMSSGLHNPGGDEGAAGGEGGGDAASPHGKPAVTIAIHAGEPKPSDFKGARKAAKSAMESGSLPSETERTMNKRKG